MNRNAIHPKASDALIKICQYYKQTGKESFDALEAVGMIEDSYLTELVNNGYISVKFNVSTTITILDRAKKFSAQLG